MNKMDWELRSRIVREIVAEYVMEYTCATMSDSYGQVVGGQKDADEWLKGKKLLFAITDKELTEALDAVYKRMGEGSAFCYNKSLFKEEKNDL